MSDQKRLVSWPCCHSAAGCLNWYVAESYAVPGTVAAGNTGYSLCYISGLVYFSFASRQGRQKYKRQSLIKLSNRRYYDESYNDEVLFFKVIGVIIAIVGLILPGAMVNRSERYKTLGNFVKWSLWFIVGIAIAGLGVWIFRLGR